MIAGFFVFLSFFAAGFLAVGFLVGVVAYTFQRLGGLLVVSPAGFFAMVDHLAAGFWAGVVAVSALAASAVVCRVLPGGCPGVRLLGLGEPLRSFRAVMAVAIILAYGAWAGLTVGFLACCM